MNVAFCICMLLIIKEMGFHDQMVSLLTSTITVRINLLALLLKGKWNGLQISDISFLLIFGYKLYVIQSKMPLIIICLMITEMLTFKKKKGQQQLQNIINCKMHPDFSNAEMWKKGALESVRNGTQVCEDSAWIPCTHMFILQLRLQKHTFANVHF